MATYLTDHFTLEELMATSKKLDNTPNEAQRNNLKRLAVLLEDIRTLVGKPINVTSGFRSLAVNRAVGGSLGSAHAKGLAADINAKGLTSTQLATLIKDSGIIFDQLILEFPNTSGTWVHIGLSDSKPRRQILTAKTVDKRTQYLIGLQP